MKILVACEESQVVTNETLTKENQGENNE